MRHKGFLRELHLSGKAYFGEKALKEDIEVYKADAQDEIAALRSELDRISSTTQEGSDRLRAELEAARSQEAILQESNNQHQSLLMHERSLVENLRHRLDEWKREAASKTDLAHAHKKTADQSKDRIDGLEQQVGKLQEELGRSRCSSFEANGVYHLRPSAPILTPPSLLKARSSYMHVVDSLVRRLDVGPPTTVQEDATKVQLFRGNQQVLDHLDRQIQQPGKERTHLESQSQLSKDSFERKMQAIRSDTYWQYESRVGNQERIQQLERDLDFERNARINIGTWKEERLVELERQAKEFETREQLLKDSAQELTLGNEDLIGTVKEQRKENNHLEARLAKKVYAVKQSKTAEEYLKNKIQEYTRGNRDLLQKTKKKDEEIPGAGVTFGGV